MEIHLNLRPHTHNRSFFLGAYYLWTTRSRFAKAARLAAWKPTALAAPGPSELLGFGSPRNVGRTVGPSHSVPQLVSLFMMIMAGATTIELDKLMHQKNSWYFTYVSPLGM